MLDTLWMLTDVIGYTAIFLAVYLGGTIWMDIKKEEAFYYE